MALVGGSEAAHNYYSGRGRSTELSTSSSETMVSVLQRGHEKGALQRVPTVIDHWQDHRAISCLRQRNMVIGPSSWTASERKFTL